MDQAARTRTTGLAFAVLSSVAFGASGPFGKALIGAGLTPLQAVWLRIAGAALVLVPLVLLLRGPAAGRALRPHLPRLAVYGVTGVAGCQAFYFVAASRLPVGIAILLEFTGPVMVLAWLRLARRARVHRTAVVGVAVAVAGLAMVVQVWAGLALDALGLAAGLGAAACQAAYFLIIDRLAGQVDPLAMTAVGSVVAAAALTFVAVPWTLPWHVLAEQVAVGDRAAPGWLLAAWIVLVSTVLAYLAGVAGVQRLSAQVAGAVCYTEAVAATLIAWAALGERLAPVQIAGGAVVLAGAFIAQRAVIDRDPAVPAPRAAAPALDRP
ncbi:DMT family transporter [Spirillospora sp. NPDC029432]|uniref:EamA family transporter n=1 Tax=Spirillospora sp. NPDC029432 TaxID=3154599 RepID=UPI00345398DD